MKKRANPDSEENIRRIDTKPRAKKQTHGFQVHLLRGRKTITKLFSDTNYGGKEAARKAARKFRQATMGDLPTRVFAGPPGSAPKKNAKAASVKVAAPKAAPAKAKAKARR